MRDSCPSEASSGDDKLAFVERQACHESSCRRRYRPVCGLNRCRAPGLEPQHGHRTPDLGGLRIGNGSAGTLGCADANASSALTGRCVCTPELRGSSRVLCGPGLYSMSAHRQQIPKSCAHGNSTLSPICCEINRPTKGFSFSPVLAKTKSFSPSDQSSLKLVVNAEIQICRTGALGDTTNRAPSSKLMCNAPD